MKTPWLLKEYRRRQRIRNPKKYDHCSFMLLQIMGAKWWIERGFYREVKVSGFMIDFAHPKYKIAIEGDGEKWHRDIVREQMRDEALHRRGWFVQHFTFDQLATRKAWVRERMNQIWASYQRISPEHEAKIREQMRKSGM